MLSRVAENIYWLARYVERAENTARLINVNTNLLLDLPGTASPGWEPIIDILGASDAYATDGEAKDERTALRYLIADTHNPVSIISSLSMARENCRTIRDIIPREAWEAINDLYLFAREQANKGISKRGRYDYMKAIISGAQGMTGLLAGTMLHDVGYEFLRMGRNLERADMTTRIIDVRSETLLPDVSGALTPFENIQWMSVLKSLTGYQMYRRAIQVRVNRPDVLKFLFQEKGFPRSFYHCICEVSVSLSAMPHNEKPIELLEKLQEDVLHVDAAFLKQEQLRKFIDNLQLRLGGIHEVISRVYFLYT